jgi:hypothetical protein|tara:strand:+ start:5233 stop:5508 length:276 start_codon:yes stop_codon:yes gene_type:complete
MKIAYRKVTPVRELSWYIKWSSSVLILIGMVLISAGGTYPLLQMIISLIGVAGWGIVGILWHDRALIVVNAMAVFIYLTGVVKFLMKGAVI